MVSKFFTCASLILSIVITTGVRAQAAREILPAQQMNNFEKHLRSFTATSCRVIELASYGSQLEFVILDGDETIRARIDSYDLVTKSYIGYGPNKTAFEVKPFFKNNVMVYLNIDKYSFKPDLTFDSGVRRSLTERMTCGAAKK